MITMMVMTVAKEDPASLFDVVYEEMLMFNVFDKKFLIDGKS